MQSAGHGKAVVSFRCPAGCRRVSVARACQHEGIGDASTANLACLPRPRLTRKRSV